MSVPCTQTKQPFYAVSVTVIKNKCLTAIIVPTVYHPMAIVIITSTVSQSRVILITM